MLTKRQHDLLLLIDQTIRDKGICPSYQEMMEAVGLHSKSGVHRIITALEERGFIKRLQNRARALEVLKLPQDVAPKKRTGNVVSLDNARQEKAPVPFYGKIAAGTPIEAIADISNHIDMPMELLGMGDYYALEIEGDSMMAIGIMDGDTVYIERATTARNGDIVVALVDDEEATLKRFQKDGEDIILIPENELYPIQRYHASRVQIQGRLVGLMRRYQ